MMQRILSSSSIILALAFLVVCLQAEPVPFKDCGSATTVKNIVLDIKDCPKFPCPFIKKTNSSMNVQFTTEKAFPKMTNLLYGIIAGVKIPFPVPMADACVNDMPCPTVPGTSYTQKIVIPILSEYPSISLYVQYQLNDENNNPVICGLFPVKIQ